MTIETGKLKATFIATSVIALLTLSPFGSLNTTPTANAEQTIPQTKIANAATLKPGEMMTPFGPQNESKIVQLSKGEIFHTSKSSGDKGSFAPDAYPTAWNEYANNVPASITSFSGVWRVPKEPDNWERYSTAQVAYNFIGINDLGYHAIAQPVIQFGCSQQIGYILPCENYWIAAVWFWQDGVPAVSKNWFDVNPGDQIEGSIVQGQSSSLWIVTITDVTTGQSDSEEFDSNYNLEETSVAFESYNLPQLCSWLPGNVDFSSLSVNGGEAGPWNAWYNTVWCAMGPPNGVEIVSPTEIILHTTDTAGAFIYAKSQGTGHYVPGLYTSVYNSANQLVASGYTPLYVPISTTGTYTIDMDNYAPYTYTSASATTSGVVQSYNTYGWGMAVTASLPSTTDVHIDGMVASTGSLSVNAIDQNNNPVTGLYMQLQDDSQTQIAAGWTPVTFSNLDSSTYTVYANDYCSSHTQYSFSHWTDGTTTRGDTVTISGSNVAKTAVYNVGTC
jgi:hypothetical protein